jgi:hypothetical protein
MRPILSSVVLMVLVVLSVADAQQYMPAYPPAPAQGYAPPQPPQGHSPYDQQYAGPMNVYGQPTFSAPHYGNVPGARQQQQQAQAGYIPMAAEGLSSLGSYLWSFMPAPLTGAKSPYDVPQGSGQVNVNFVPGNR